MLGINLEKLAEAEFGKLETAVLSSPEFQKVEAKAQADIVKVKAFTAKITPAEEAAALNILFPGKFTVAEITEFQTAVTDLETVISNPTAVLADIKKAL